MPDFNQLDQCAMLAKALWFMPPPARGPIAAGLYDLGVRVHPELASKELLAEGPPGLGAHRQQRLVGIDSQAQGMAFMRQFRPELAAKIDAATTGAQREQLCAEIGARHPEIIAEAEQKVAELISESQQDGV